MDISFAENRLAHSSFLSRYGKSIKKQVGPKTGDGLGHLDKLPAWWHDDMTELTPAERFRLAFLYTRKRAMAFSAYEEHNRLFKKRKRGP